LLKEKNAFVDYVHGLNMVVIPWQMADDLVRISEDPIAEYYKLSKLGVDGFFTDFCNSGIFVRDHLKNLKFDFGQKYSSK